ncbi:DUF6531 domain-containing protein, partial [Candidatus Uhrbacteria bacterium]|nr:DUF6531 domain-containing protein [Candidatus Uhrbacteria bacterium]
YLGAQNRLVTRFGTIMADTVRPEEIRVAGQNPPIADGAIQDTVYLHSGELQAGAVDFGAGGRAGFDVIFDRTYRSRTLGGTILGQGWDSSNLRRLRPLPNGDVELRDGSGETWLFTAREDGQGYDSPKGYFLKLFRAERGWVLLDQRWRAVGFDELGRLMYESDEFASEAAIGAGTNKGNVIRYLYDAGGRLAQIVDPVERATQMTYWGDSEAGQTGAYPGLLKEAKDWRNRSALFEYDSLGRLTNVSAPEMAAGTGVPSEFNFTGANRPRTEYTYQSVSQPPEAAGPTQAFNDYVEFIGNLETIKDPDQAAGGTARVTVTFGNGGYERDRLTEQEWATGESATVSHSGPTDVSTVDAYGQRRSYTLTDRSLHDKRAHIAEERAESVAVIEASSLPGSASVSMSHSSQTLTTSFTYNDEGLYETIEQPSGLRVVNTWAYAKNASSEGDRSASVAPGMVLERSTSTGPQMSTLETDVQYDQQNDNAKATPVKVGRGTKYRSAESPSGQKLRIEEEEDGFSTETEFNDAGLPIAARKKDASDSIRQETITDYFDAAATPLLARSRPSETSTSTDDIRQSFEYFPLDNGGEKVIATDDVRDTKTETHYDAYGRKTVEIITGSDQTLANETFGYDAAGRLAYHSRTQSGVGNVITRSKYDAMGRLIETSTTGAAVNGSLTTLTQKTEYDYPGRTVTEYDPSPDGTGSARTVKELDGFGRPRRTERVGSGGESIVTITGFDSGGAPSYASDGVRIAEMKLNDGLGRTVASVRSDGVRTETVWTDWSEPLEIIHRDANGDVIGHVKNT